MDGVPGLSFDGIHPADCTYRFTVKQSGTYWYHSHSGFQEQLGVYGPLVIEPREPEPFRYDREHVVMLSDWTDENPERVLRQAEEAVRLLQLPQRTVGDFFRDVPTQRPASATLAERRAWARDAHERRATSPTSPATPTPT